MTRSRQMAPVPPGRSTNVRLLMSIGMLVILALLIFQARDPRNWTWLTGEEAKRKPVFVEYKVQDGPTDADPNEWAEVSKGFSAVEDKRSKDDFANAVIKNRYLKWVLRQKPEDLYRRKPATESLIDLTNHPNEFRGKLVRFRLRIKRCIPVPSPDPTNPDFANLHEMLGFQDKTGLWLYWLLTPGIPKGFPVGDVLDGETVDVVGYFHCLRGYADANEKSWTAPEIVGTPVWYPIEKLPPQPIQWPIVAGLAIALPIGVLVLWKMLSGPPSVAPPPRTRSGVDVSDWLDKGPEHSALDDLDADERPPGVNGRSG